MLYEFKIKPGCESEFRKFWREVTAESVKKDGSLGARLHASEEGGFIAYAQWKDRKSWESGHKDIERRSMEINIDDLLLEIPTVLRHMQSLDDLLVED